MNDEERIQNLYEAMLVKNRFNTTIEWNGLLIAANVYLPNIPEPDDTEEVNDTSFVDYNDINEWNQFVEENNLTGKDVNTIIDIYAPDINSKMIEKRREARRNKF